MTIDIVMSILETISKCGYTDEELLEYIDENFDEIECELNGEEYEEPKKCDRYFCIDCKSIKIVDYESRFWFALNVEYLSAILFMCNHTIIRCDIRE